MKRKIPRTEEEQHQFERSIKNMKYQGYSVKQLALHHKTSEKTVCLVLGISKGDTSVAYSQVHTGPDQDLTGKFREISTMKWI